MVTFFLGTVLNTIALVYPQNCLLSWVLLFSLLANEEADVQKRLTNLPKVTQLGSSQPEIKPR
jgi:hypothetical protein